MAKETTLTAQIARTVQKQKAEEAAEDAAVRGRAAPDGKVWVRLIRPCYDRDGVYHAVGIVALPPDQVPSSAIPLTGIPGASDE